MARLRMQLVARATADGLMEVHDHVPLGTVYEVDPDSLQLVQGYNLLARRTWKRWMVQDVSTGTWLPTEVLAPMEDP